MSLDIREKFFTDGFVRINLGEQTPRDLLELSKQLGKALIVGKHHIPGHRRIQKVSEDGLFRREAVPWHNDFSYSVGEYHGTLLYHHSGLTSVPTEFTDNLKAYDALPEETKAYLDGIEAEFVAPEHYHDLLHKPQLELVTRSVIRRKVALKHPITGRTSLYYSPATIQNPSHPLDIENLLQVSERYSFKVNYKPHDIVIFDNLRMMHRRPAFEGKRTLHRISFRYVQ